MVDTVNKEKRSQIMSLVRGQDTKPEMIVRRLVFSYGYRYRLHDSKLPGKPDLVFSGKRKIICVNGCFWHGHNCSRGNRLPKSNADYWRSKIDRNRERDATNAAKLESDGWKVLIIWECELANIERIISRIRSFLG